MRGRRQEAALYAFNHDHAFNDAGLRVGLGAIGQPSRVNAHFVGQGGFRWLVE
jgi:hypothetical protein